jgi:DNA-binding transcriptional ArsR family regulator
MDATMDIAQLQKNAQRATALLKSMANEWRLLVLCHLATGELSVGDLEKSIGLSQSALSQHLAILRRERLVTTRRSAQSIYYSLSSGEAEAVMSTLYDLYCSDALPVDVAAAKSA